MGARKYRDITIRGVTYPTAQAAAEALGVTADAVRIALRQGRLHRTGTGASHPEPIPVRIRGVVYSTAREAAEALGVTPSAIYQALAQNRIDSVGLGARCPNPSRARPFAVGSVTYPSMAAADRALGFRPGYISMTLRRGYKSGRERILAAAMRVALGRAA